MRTTILAIPLRLLIVIHLLLMSMLTSAAPSIEKHLTLVFAGNMPDIGNNTYGTYTGLAGLLEKLRAEETPTIFAFGGGSLGPSPLSSLDRGSHIIDILNTLEPDLMTLTKREFSYFEDELTLRSNEAAFPIVSSNLYDPITNNNLEGILNSIIIEKDNTKVGFISILDEEVVEEYLLKRVSVLKPRQVIQQKILALKQAGAELVILVYSNDKDYYQTLIAENKIDFALRVVNAGEQHKSNKTYTIARKSPIKLLRISWTINNSEKNLTIETPEIDYSYQPTQVTTSLLIDEYNQRLNRLLNQKIGFLSHEIHTLRNLVRTRETPFGNFVTDAMKHYAKADIGLLNGGGIRGDKIYAKGSIITRRDIATELPFRERITTLFLTGEQLKQTLENSVSAVEFEEGRFLQVSGISFTYTIEKPAGERIKSVHVNGIELDLKQKYSVATSNYLAHGGDGYKVLMNALPQNQNTQEHPLISDIVIRMTQQQKTINSKKEFRIKRIIK